MPPRLSIASLEECLRKIQRENFTSLSFIRKRFLLDGKRYSLLTIQETMFRAIQRGTVEEANKRYRLRAQLNQVPEQHSSSESIIVLSSSDSTSHPSSSRLLQTSEHEASGGNIRRESEEQPAEVDEANGGRFGC